MEKTALVILAAGIGSRFGGGVKQMEPLGPGGEIMIDYSVHDALEAGFNKVVFIIRRALDADFREVIGDRISAFTEVAYAYQEAEDLPAGFALPEGRTKPWGTGHALLAAKDVITEPFAVINADDYYGKEGFRELHGMLTAEPDADSGKEPVCLAAFVLGNTLSENGGVTRGILEFDAAGRLSGIHETKNLIRTPEGAAVITDSGLVKVDSESLVSMNMWGFRPSFIGQLEARFPAFLSSLEGEKRLSGEFLLPTIVDGMLNSGEAAVRLLRTDDRWFGVTYKEDRDFVREEFARLVGEGVYPCPLWA